VNEQRLESLGPTGVWRGEERYLFSKGATWAGRGPAKEATDLQGEPDSAPCHGQIKEGAPSAAMDLSREVATAWAGPLGGGEASDEGEALLAQDDLLHQQIWDRGEQGGKAHSDILWG
jgi:hypothetical protein